MWSISEVSQKSEQSAGVESERSLLPLQDHTHPLPRLATHESAPYLAGNTTRRGHSLAGYQLLWKGLPIARREETTVKAQ